MRVSLSWLREFVPVDLDRGGAGGRIDTRGMKVRGMSRSRPWPGSMGWLIASVLEVRDHPNSDKLCALRRSTGAIACRSSWHPEHDTGDRVPWAKPARNP